MNETGQVEVRITNDIGRIVFSHPKANCLPRHALTKIAQAFRQLSADSQAKVILLASAGEGAFSAGAAFEEFEQIRNAKDGEAFFLGFSEVLLAMRAARKLIVGRVQGKAVGGGVGLIAGCDYVFGLNNAAIRLSEFELGIGPFVVGPAIERKIGLGAFSALCIDCKWRDADWAKKNGLFQQVFATAKELDEEIEKELLRLARLSSSASQAIREMLWADTEEWPAMLPKRASMSGRLLADSRANSQKS